MNFNKQSFFCLTRTRRASRLPDSHVPSPSLRFFPTLVFGARFYSSPLAVMMVFETLGHTDRVILRFAAGIALLCMALVWYCVYRYHHPSVKIVKKITKPERLIWLAKNGTDLEVRRAAVGNPNLTDPSVLADIAKTRNYSRVQGAAVMKLVDQALLADIAKTSQDTDVRSEAVRNVTDQEIFEDLSKNDKILDLLRKTLWHIEFKKISDRELLFIRKLHQSKKFGKYLTPNMQLEGHSDHDYRHLDADPHSDYIDSDSDHVDSSFDPCYPHEDVPGTYL